MKHKGTKTLETKRLILRKFTKDDIIPSYKNWTSDERVCKYVTWPKHEDVEVTENILSEWIDGYKNDNFYQWAICLKDGEVIGTISVDKIDEDIESIEIGYVIGYNYWGNGYVHEAFEEVIKFLFEEVEVNRIQARHDVDNPNSGKVMLKSGLTYEGCLRQTVKNHSGSLVDIKLYSILREEYLPKK